MNLKIKLLLIFTLFVSFTFGQNRLSEETLPSNTKSQIAYRHSLGSSVFMLGNLLEVSPDYYLLTYGYQLTKKDRVFAEFNTWKFSEPLGTYIKSGLSFNKL